MPCWSFSNLSNEFCWTAFLLFHHKAGLKHFTSLLVAQWAFAWLKSIISECWAKLHCTWFDQASTRQILSFTYKIYQHEASCTKLDKCRTGCQSNWLNWEDVLFRYSGNVSVFILEIITKMWVKIILKNTICTTKYFTYILHHIFKGNDQRLINILFNF